MMRACSLVGRCRESSFLCAPTDRPSFLHAQNSAPELLASEQEWLGVPRLAFFERAGNKFSLDTPKLHVTRSSGETMTDAYVYPVNSLAAMFLAALSLSLGRMAS